MLIALPLLLNLSSNMFDLQGYVADIEEVLSASQRPIPDDVYQPEFYYSVLRANILKLPAEWDSKVQSLVLDQRHPELSRIIEGLALDLEECPNDRYRRLAYEALHKYAVVLVSNEGKMRSSGPA